MFKFKDYADYKAQRDAALADAEQTLTNGGEGYDTKVKYIQDMDAAWEEFAQKQADINALKGAVKAPMSNSEVERIATGAVGIDNDKEYRMQFMNYVLNGTPIKLQNADQVTATTDVGAVIPQTIIDRIVEKMEKLGNLLNMVTRTYYKGGVAVPTSAAKPTAKWVAERGTVEKQKKAVGSVTFNYYKLKVVIAVSLAVENVTLEVFERTLSDNVAEAMVRALEEAIVAGEGASANQPEGIIKVTPVEGQKVEIANTKNITYKDLCAAEGALPEGYDDAVWCMRKATFMNQIVGMVDAQGQPVGRINAGLNGKPDYTILGRHVEVNENVPAFNQAATSDAVVGFLFRFKDYILNTNLDMRVSKYTDNDTDDECTKAIMLADGKPVDKNSYVPIILKGKTS